MKLLDLHIILLYKNIATFVKYFVKYFFLICNIFAINWEKYEE